MLESYPEFDKSLVSKAAEKEGDILKAILKDVRNYKSSHKMAPNASIKLVLTPKAPFKGIEAYFQRFLFAKTEVSKEAVLGDSFLYGKYTLFVQEDVDKETLKKRLEEEKEKLNFEIARSEKMLANPGFVSKAPKEKIELEKSKLEENKTKLETCLERLKTL